MFLPASVGALTLGTERHVSQIALTCVDRAVISIGAALYVEKLLVLRYWAEQDHLDYKKPNSVHDLVLQRVVQ